MKLRAAHASLQFTDSDKQRTHDIEKLADKAVTRKWAWVTGTEGGPGAGNAAEELYRVFPEHGYRTWIPQAQATESKNFSDCWIAVREDLVHGNWERKFDHVFDSSAEFKDKIDLRGRRWGQKGIVRVGFDNELFGRINVAAAHYIAGGNDKDNDFRELNEKLGKALDRWANQASKGTALSFYGGDQNMWDNRHDTFFGGDFVSAGDELKYYRGTLGNAPIDVIASLNKDRRVKAQRVLVFGDKNFFLHTDHKVYEATFEVEPLRKR